MFVIDEVIEQKQVLRAEMKARRAGLNESQRARASWRLCNRLSIFLEMRPERTIGVYLARPFEISLNSLISTLLHKGVTVAAPRVDVASGKMNFWRLACLDEVEFGPWGVSEPPANESIEEVPLIFVPGLAFDRKGGRLGTGGGWYDRYLREAHTTVGLGFDSQIVPRVPLEPHDLRVDFVASEERWFDVKSDSELS